MENEQRKCVVEYRPAALGMYLSEMAKYHLSSMVPCGWLTRDKDIRTALAKLFDVSWLSFERDYAQMMQVLWDDTVMRSWNRIRYNIFRKFKKGKKYRHAQKTLVE